MVVVLVVLLVLLVLHAIDIGSASSTNHQYQELLHTSRACISTHDLSDEVLILEVDSTDAVMLMDALVIGTGTST